jgi:GWxTD domain-containing protein
MKPPFFRKFAVSGLFRHIPHPMKKHIFLILALLSFGLSKASANDVKAYLLYSTFSSPDKGPYLESYLSVIGNSVVLKKNSNGKYQGAIEVSMVFKQGEEIKAVKKYTLNGPETGDTLSRPNFIDLQRIPLANGTYDFEISITDVNKGGKPFSSTQKVTVDYNAEKVIVSDIQLVESFSKSAKPGILTKSGYDLVPYVSNFYPANMKKLSFYAEVYNTKKALGENEKFVINYYIESYDTKVKLGSFSSFSRQTANNVNILLAEIPVDELISGNYNLVIEVKNKLNETMAEKKVFFQRSNPNAQIDINDMVSLNLDASFVSKIKSKDTLIDFIRSLFPISNSLEQTFADNQVVKKDMKEMQQYFLGFWMNRSQTNPEAAWLTYYEEVKKVNKEFGTANKRGYETDRGRVYLQYGPPNQRTQSENEPSAYPYEIWHYYKMKDQSNRKFVFYNPDLVTNDYQLIHSDAKGEIYDTRWELRIHSRNNQSKDLDLERSPEHMGGKTNDYFKNPR